MGMGTMGTWGQCATPAPQDGRYPSCCRAWRRQGLSPLGQTGLGEVQYWFVVLGPDWEVEAVLEQLLSRLF